jgi:hypothetical protein
MSGALSSYTLYTYPALTTTNIASVELPQDFNFFGMSIKSSYLQLHFNLRYPFIGLDGTFGFQEVEASRIL